MKRSFFLVSFRAVSARGTVKLTDFLEVSLIDMLAACRTFGVSPLFSMTALVSSKLSIQSYE